MKYIQLTQGKRSIVDDDDYERLNKYNWSYTNHGYAQRRKIIDGKSSIIHMHREIMGLTFNDGKFVDHINGDRLDNRKENLRLCTRTENNHNMKIGKHNKSGFKGVFHRTVKKKYLGRDGTRKTYHHWCAKIMINRKAILLGTFPYTEEGKIQAAKAYNEAARKYYGEFAYINDIE